ncbi:DUF86 domain-containing protein [Thermoflexus sp.]|uniref:type VII toxin-antitoxin system HepT family RNase toxin n=1 Tax=Thermoflexus sp. TaxID=1969742 RepID=UPI0025CF2121|nr:DUF86 domain-containing protein [Thermoflexus sp.]MDW8065080.1 DUF86 domain-containing protein [Anaerolineae bacterium]MCS6964385.1 DUF86 domain-containing protein [Thermoflexus sp.]MCS7352218.1 DUF86 domain-containing protein [Thermoflexus sp.]MCX7689403.1 DUF86 domain-containing protein [Thermoflexus sp.]MDW8181679.1 DUF86 domain-containing protein [Anaerolineae bacterium]
MAVRKPFDVLLAKIENIDGYIQELEPLVQTPFAEFLERPYYRRAAERLIQVIVEGAVDCGAIVLNQMGKPVPGTSREIFAYLHRFGVLDRPLAQRFQDYVGLRNRIVHDDARIEAPLVYRVDRRLIQDSRAHSSPLLRWIERAARRPR